MFSLALCDDLPVELNRMKTYISRYVQIHPEYEFSLQTFSSPLELLSRVEGGHFYQVYLLDILMPTLSGIELGRLLREHDNSCAIIFCSITPEFALESYQVHAQNYLVKPYSCNTLFHALDQALSQLEQQQAVGVCIRTEDGHAFMPFHQILYIELINRHLIFYLTDRRIVRSLSLRESLEQTLSELLSDARFLQPHKSFVVNMDHILLWGGDHLLLRGKANIPVSLRRRGLVRERSFLYLSQQKNESAARLNKFSENGQ